ncbi:MAG: GNAT family N-acetyltransferase [Phycisphaera sp.]|nr:GNAT family N-acetyltransferase [Phycisphaera sp.]
MSDPRVILKTERLILREMIAADAEHWFGILGDARAMRHFPKVYTRGEAAEWTTKNMRRYDAHGFGWWVMIRRDDGRFVGVCGISIQQIDGVGEHEIGYQLLPEFWGKGYATEAACAVRDHGFNVLNLPRLVSWMGPNNTPSRRVAERVGMTLEKETTNAATGEPHVVYAIHRQ